MISDSIREELLRLEDAMNAAPTQEAMEPSSADGSRCWWSAAHRSN